MFALKLVDRNWTSFSDPAQTISRTFRGRYLILCRSKENPKHRSVNIKHSKKWWFPRSDKFWTTVAGCAAHDFLKVLWQEVGISLYWHVRVVWSCIDQVSFGFSCLGRLTHRLTWLPMVVGQGVWKWGTGPLWAIQWRRQMMMMICWNWGDPIFRQTRIVTISPNHDPCRTTFFLLRRNIMTS